ncbi:MAG TPA: inositol monophosphatase family protein [Gaiellaceae bacterium]|jgi:histidinol-phosphatase|nr:inositol monophosphatase family protein [Gaiellaceae bacterium]
MAGADVSFALELADLADSLSLPRFRALDLRVDTKADLTPVTDADRAVERALRERIAADRPGEGVLGEEEGDEGGSVRWILDPIDGTRNFSRGIPVWATLIALERDGEIVCGVVSAPPLGRRWWAARGEGAFANGAPIRVSSIASLDEAVLSATYASDLEVLEPRAWHARGFGDFWQHMLVAEGSVDAALDAELALWDYAAPSLIVVEAGGQVTTLDGGKLEPYKRIISSNGLLHDDVIGLLHGS